MYSLVTVMNEAPTMSTYLTEMGTVVTQVMTWAGNVATTIMGNPMLVVTSGVMLCGAAIGIFGRLLSRG